MGSVHHRKSTNSYDYINGDQQYVLYYIETEQKVNLPALLFQHLKDSVKETRDGSRNMKSYISLGRMISNILMDRKLIDSLTNDPFSKCMQPLAGKMFNTKGLKNMGVIIDVISHPAEISKEVIHNRRIPLEYFPIFSKPYPLDVMVGFMEKCHACAILTTSESTSKMRRNISNKHSERMTKKFKAARETLDTSVEEPRVAGDTSAGIAFGKFIPFEDRLLNVDNNVRTKLVLQ